MNRAQSAPARAETKAIAELERRAAAGGNPFPRRSPEQDEAIVRYEPARLPASSAERKTIPMATGLLDYFPDALAEVARISFKGNQKHNPGEPLHWSRNKSADHADCVARHLTERGNQDAEGNDHSAQLCWRALALYQEEIERRRGLPISRGSTET